MRNTIINIADTVSATISSGTSLSGAVNLGGLRLFGIVMPSTWTTANLTFQMSYDGGTTWVNMYDASGNELTVAASTSRYIALDPLLYSSVSMIKVRSGTSSASVSQGQDSTLQLSLRAI